MEYFVNCIQLENDFKRLSELTKGRVEKIHLIGGEPLLHPQCVKIISIAGKYFGSGVVEIIRLV
jgi:molybdenum cofactor biosynthesis enzyme MoaA